MSREKAARLSGCTIKSVEEKTFTVAHADGSPDKRCNCEGVKCSLNGAACTWADLKPGDKVFVEADHVAAWREETQTEPAPAKTPAKTPPKTPSRSAFGD